MKSVAKTLIDLAEGHLPASTPELRNSAQICLTDAQSLLGRRAYRHAAQRAVTSLSFSVGIFHPDTMRGQHAVAVANLDRIYR